METYLIEPTKKHSRKNLFSSILIVVAMLAFTEIAYPILKPFRTHHIPFTDGFFWVISFIVIIYFLPRKIYQSIEVNDIKKELKISYITLLKSNCETIVTYEKLKYEYKAKPSRTGRKVVLSIWNGNKKVFSIENEEWGFDKEKLDFIAEKLKDLQ